MPPLAPPSAEMLGRTGELHALMAHAGLAADGTSRTPGGHAVLLGGDAGLGKTRLLVALTDRVRAAGWRVMVGHCLDMADLLLPYLPFSELIGRFADEEPERARDVVGGHPAVAALTPGRRLLGGREPGRADERLDRAELFDHVHAALEELAAEAPLLVVVEDLHWADQSTRDLVTFLLTRAFRGPVCLVGSYRSDDLHRRHPLRSALAAWGWLPGVLRSQLGPLPDGDLRELVRALAPSLREREATEIVGRAGGNPFFAGELVAAHLHPPVDGHARHARGPGFDTGLPETLADVLLVRLDALDDASRQVVRAASCSGRKVTHQLLSAVVDLPDDELERALRDAVEANVLVKVDTDGYAFRHALLAEAVHDDLLPGERVRLHGRYVDALVGGTVAGTAAELATHARAAHDHATAVRAGIRAGQDAMAVGGPDDAATHYEAALEMLSRTGVEPPDGVDVVGLVERTAQAVVATGQPGRAMALVRDHLATVGAALDPVARARLLMALVAAALVNESTDEPVDVTTEVLGLVGDEPTRLRARALSQHARALANSGRREEAVGFAGEALALAQRVEMPEVSAEATTTLANLDVQSGDHQAAEAALDQVVLAARAAGDTEGEMRGRYHLALVHLEDGRLAEAQRLFQLAADSAARAGRPWAPYGFDARYHAAMTAYLVGSWDECLAIADFAGQAPPADPEALLCSAAMLVGAGRGEEPALRHYERWRSAWPREALVAVNTGAAALDLVGLRGDVDGLWRVYDEVVASASRSWSPVFQAKIRLSALLGGNLADALAASAVTDPGATVERMAAVMAEVDAIAARAASRPRGFGPEGRAWAQRARAEWGWLRHLAGDAGAPGADELESSWRDTVGLFDELGHRYEAARSRARLAAVLAVRRDPGAAAVAEEAHAVAEALGAAPLAAATAAGTQRSPVDPTPGDGPLLTPREAEVLALVAEGRTNGDVARRLFISTKTVSVHVSNLLAKLGAASRTEAVAVARRHGLLDD